MGLISGINVRKRKNIMIIIEGIYRFIIIMDYLICIYT